MNYFYDEPTDETADWNRRVVMSKDMAVKLHRQYFEWAAGVVDVEDDMVFEDWIICNWACPTDMPAGEYFSHASNWRR